MSGGRYTIITFALVGLLGAYLIGRIISGWAAGLAAAALLAVAPPFPTFAAIVSADLPSFALGLLALAFLLFALDGRAPLVCSALSGALLAASLSVKVSAVTLLVPVAGFLWARRLYVHPGMLVALVLGFAAVALALVAGYRGGLHGIWVGAVDYHDRARSVPGTGARPRRQRRTASSTSSTCGRRSPGSCCSPSSSRSRPGARASACRCGRSSPGPSPPPSS